MTDANIVRVTYAELAHARGVSMAAARRLAQRHRWPKRVGNDGLSHVLVPATYLARSEPDRGDVATDIVGDVAGDVATNDRDLQVLSFDEMIAAFTDVARDVADRVATDVGGNVITTLREQLTAERERADRAENRAEAAEGQVRKLIEQLVTEQILRAEDKERITGAEQRAEAAKVRAEQSERHAQEAEGRVRDLQEQLTAEMIEHRRVVGLLTEQLAARRSWWPWRRRS